MAGRYWVMSRVGIKDRVSGVALHPLWLLKFRINIVNYTTYLKLKYI